MFVSVEVREYSNVDVGEYENAGASAYINVTKVGASKYLLETNYPLLNSLKKSFDKEELIITYPNPRPDSIYKDLLYQFAADGMGIEIFCNVDYINNNSIVLNYHNRQYADRLISKVRKHTSTAKLPSKMVSCGV